MFLESLESLLVLDHVTYLLELLFLLRVLLKKELFLQILDVLLDLLEHAANLKLIAG